jgi:hypothetical protein
MIPISEVIEACARAEIGRKDAVIKDFWERRDEVHQLRAEVEALREALTDMHEGWKYIRRYYGDLHGVGWDRCDEKARAALTKEKA